MFIFRINRVNKATVFNWLRLRINEMYLSLSAALCQFEFDLAVTLICIRAFANLNPSGLVIVVIIIVISRLCQLVKGLRDAKRLCHRPIGTYSLSLICGKLTQRLLSVTTNKCPSASSLLRSMQSSPIFNGFAAADQPQVQRVANAIERVVRPVKSYLYCIVNIEEESHVRWMFPSLLLLLF